MTITRFRAGLAAAFVLGIAALFAIVGKAQGPALPPGEYDLEAGQYIFNVPELIETPVPPTETPIPPTDTPTPPPAHDPDMWHPLTEEFGHTHNADPSGLSNIFGPPRSQTISYPWQTPNENIIKHEGYKWDVMERDECVPADPFGTGPDSNCAKAWRIQFHALGLKGARHRFHSYYAEIQICVAPDGPCGILKTGGHADFGTLHVPYAGPRVFLPGEDPELDDIPPEIQRQPYRGHSEYLPDVPGENICGSGSGNCVYTWNSDSRYGYNLLVAYDFRARDDFGPIDPADPFADIFVCPDLQCEFNHSEFHIYAIEGTIPAELDTDGDGFVAYEGFTDRRGNIIGDCAPFGPDCIPLSMTNVPVGRYSFENGDPPGTFPFQEYDISPPGESWIRFPN